MVRVAKNAIGVLVTQSEGLNLPSTSRALFASKSTALIIALLGLQREIYSGGRVQFGSARYVPCVGFVHIVIPPTGVSVRSER